MIAAGYGLCRSEVKTKKQKFLLNIAGAFIFLSGIFTSFVYLAFATKW